MFKKFFFFIFFACILNASPVYLNQAGFLINSVKFVYFSEKADSFYVKDSNSKEILFCGKVELYKSNDTATGLNVFRGDFSGFKNAGRYIITDNFGNSSVAFTIADTVFNSVFRKSLKNFYYQRCGFDLTNKFAGVYEHPACHVKTDGIFHESTDTTGASDVTGGWHDAGDYGKYVINAGITVGTLLMAYELFPDSFSYDDLNIPESENNIPDILDEIKYELDWLLKMQRANGAVFFKVTRKSFEGFIMPHDDDVTRYIYAESSTSTADFAAVTAQAYRIYKKFDPAFADKCLNASKKAWVFLENHPGIFPANGFKNPADTRTGEYGDNNDSDERLWAAAELFLSTGNDSYNKYFENNYSKEGIINSTFAWPNLNSFAQLVYLLGNSNASNNTITINIRARLSESCDFLMDKINSQGFNVVLSSGEYGWGSNGEILNRAIMLILCFEQFKDQKYFDAALLQLNYVLGANANNISFVTSVGQNSTMHPHHRPSGADGIADPVPGIIAGGPNKNLEDGVLRKKFHPGYPSALCYADEQGSYSSNENCINWNAPLVFVSGYFNNAGVSLKIR